MNYYERYVGDYLRDTQHLSLLEHGAYNVLLDVYYANEQPLPAAMECVYRICRAVTKPEQAAVRSVCEQFFFVVADGTRHHNRCDREIEKAQRRIAAVRKNGRRGGRPPKPKDNLTGFEKPAKDNPENNLSGFQNTQKQEPKTNLAETYSGEASPHATRKAAIGNSHASAQIPQGETLEARACRLMREVGCIRVNPLHTDLIAAIAEWVTPETLAATAAEAIEKGKGNPFEWAIATARGRAADGGRNGGTRGAGGGESLCDRAERLAREGDERERLAANG